jgi:hypothetical protein
MVIIYRMMKVAFSTHGTDWGGIEENKIRPLGRPSVIGMIILKWILHRVCGCDLYSYG